MRSGVKYCELSSVCTSITDGSHFSPKEDPEGLIPMLSVKDMTADGFDYSSCKYICESDYRVLVSNGCRPSVGDVLVAKDGSYLKTAFVQKEDKEQALLSSIAILTPKTDIILPEYLAFFFKAPHTKATVERHYLTGTAIKRVILKGFKVIKAPVPPLSEQERIVAELDLLQSIIAKQKAQLKELDTLAQSVFYDMFGDPVENEKGWKKDTINSFAVCVAGATPSTANKEYWDNGDIPWLSSGEVSQGRLYQTEKHITKTGYDNASTKMVPAHTALIALAGQGRTRGTVGVTEIPLCTNQSICSILADNTVNTDFLYYQLKMLYNELRSISNGDGGRGGLNLKLVSGFKVVLPPLNLQQSFAAKVLSLEQQKSLITQSIAETQKLFDYTMDKYFG